MTTAGWSAPDDRGHITFTQVGGDCLTAQAPEKEGFECYWVGKHGTEYTRWVYKPLRCLDASPDCEGAVEYRHALSGTGKSFLRCDHHWDKRLGVQDGINRRYPVHAPADFDPSYAGESWDED